MGRKPRSTAERSSHPDNQAVRGTRRPRLSSWRRVPAGPPVLKVAKRILIRIGGSNRVRREHDERSRHCVRPSPGRCIVRDGFRRDPRSRVVPSTAADRSEEAGTVRLSAGPPVSVVTCFLDAERFLVETIRSVLAQTHEAWELLLVDDGSRDASREIARDYARRFP